LSFSAAVVTVLRVAKHRLPDTEKEAHRASLIFWIIDDDLQFGKSLKRILNSTGMSAEHFGSAQLFLDSVPPGQSGCAIVDINMPGYDGFELIKKMRDLHYNVPVIVITGYMDNRTKDQAIQIGAIGYLQKPFAEDSLMELIDMLET
jgi:two-component system, LuxR family, response regulator FixJ